MLFYSCHDNIYRSELLVCIHFYCTSGPSAVEWSCNVVSLHHPAVMTQSSLSCLLCYLLSMLAIPVFLLVVFLVEFMVYDVL